jgi:excisionase family DNA binding protein
MESLLNIKQLSEMICFSTRTIYEWTHIGFIPHYKFPKGVRFKKSEIEKWLRKKEIKGRYNYKISCSLID